MTVSCKSSGSCLLLSGAVWAPICLSSLPEPLLSTHLSCLCPSARQHLQPICRALTEMKAFLGCMQILFNAFFFQHAPHMAFSLFSSEMVTAICFTGAARSCRWVMLK